MIKTKLKQHKDHYFLEKNDVSCTCPFRNPIMIPGQLQGQIQYQDIPCSSLCPLFIITKDPDSTTSIELTCSNAIIGIDEIVMESKLQKL